MALPTTYTESSLIGFMETELGPVADSLGLLETDALLEASNEVVGLLGHALSEEVDVVKVRALARWQCWLAAEAAAVEAVDLKAGSAGLTRSQLFDHITRRLARAELSVLAYDEVQGIFNVVGPAAVTTTTGGVGNPYGWASGPEFG